MEIITEIFKIINAKNVLPKCFSFYFITLKYRNVHDFERQNVAFSQCLQSPVHCFKTVIIVHLFFLGYDIFICKILLKSCIKKFHFTTSLRPANNYAKRT